MEFLAALMCGPLDRLRGHSSHILNLRILDKTVLCCGSVSRLGLLPGGVAVLVSGGRHDVWNVPWMGDSIGLGTR